MDARLNFGWISLLTLLLLALPGCRKPPPERTDEQGHVIVQPKPAEQANAEATHQQMLEEMKQFDESVDRWMADQEIQPENQEIRLVEVQPFLTGRLATAVKNGELLDPLGNPYVLLPLRPDSNVRISVSPLTAGRPEYKDSFWGEYAPK